MKANKPYGMWPSPITPQNLSQRLSFMDVQWDSDGQSIVWVQGHSGRSVLVAQTGKDAPRQLIDTLSVEGSVGYGGGEFHLLHRQIIFAEENGRLYLHSLDYGQPEPITPPFGGVASPAISPDGRWVVFVFSDGNTDLLGLVDSSGQDWPVQLARGADFYNAAGLASGLARCSPGWNGIIPICPGTAQSSGWPN